ncbi:MFS general substrate transporter [Pseudovirgaria hyperparasitica]|uniref:MFS general substrate transporter n=1 Tax=Pseudovirgaria hyperparasitica TaxID=470096 RepID=A0A6A6W7V1_9PEZI|nr:MFS general substrate transporter [Pseudovirgaria hyperparasitica]KAF2758615.1 MFS general substrate transporter [Pseudovirgaria hyperparasitica]
MLPGDDSSATVTEQSSLLHQSRPSSRSSTGTIANGQDAGGASFQDPQVEKITSMTATESVIVCISIGVLMFLLTSNMSMITTIQSAIATDLDAFEEAEWFTTAYMVTMSVISPLMGRLSQTFSPRICMVAASVLMGVGSIITGASSTARVFLFGRAITGLGAGGTMTGATIIIIHLAPVATRGVWLGAAASVMTVGLSLGAVIAGGLEPYVGWNYLFGMQAPISFVPGLCLFFFLPTHTGLNHKRVALKRRLQNIDYLGAITLAVGITMFLIGVSGRSILLVPTLSSLPAFMIFVFVERFFAVEPIIPLSVLKSRGALLTSLATLGFMMSRWAILFYTPVYAIAVRNRSPAVAGLILIPTNAGFGLGGLLSGWFHIRREGSFYIPSLVSMAIFPATMLAIALISTPTSPNALYVAFLFLNGLATGCVVNYTLVHVLHLLPKEVHPIMMSLVATFRGLAGSFGSAVGGGLFLRILASSLDDGFKKHGISGREDLIKRLLGSPATVQQLVGKERQIALASYVVGLRGLFLAGVGLSAVMVFLQAGTGWTGYHEKNQLLTRSDIDGDEIHVEESLLGTS